MAERDLTNDILQKPALSIQAIGSNTTTNSTEIDTKGFESLTFITFAGTLTDGTFTPLIHDTDSTGTSYVAVADEFLIGTEAAAAVDTSDTALRVGYNGKKRFVRLSYVSTSVSSGGTVGALAILGNARTNATDAS